MKKTALSVLAVALTVALPLAGCNKKTEAPASEVSQELPVARKIDELIKKAEAGDTEAQVVLAEIFANGDGIPKDSTRAADLFRKAAEKGTAKAQFRLGQMYVRGEGVPKDAVRAADLIKQSASNGYAKGQALLGAMYAKGEGVTKDEVLAYAWSALAVTQGEMDAKQTQDSVQLTTALHDEGERIKAKWKQGMALVREKEEKIVPVAPTKR